MSKIAACRTLLSADEHIGPLDAAGSRQLPLTVGLLTAAAPYVPAPLLLRIPVHPHTTAMQ